MGDVFELNDNRKLYEVLGVVPTATTEDIKRAYKRLAILFHPDKNPEGADTFKEISFAHGILADEEQRRMYDNKTLRKHIDGQAKAYDPAMDPNVELTGKQLFEFVERLRSDQFDAEKRKREFEERRQAERLRQEEYNLRNPNYKMLDIPTTTTTVTDFQAHQKTSAELLARLEKMQTRPHQSPEDVISSYKSSSGGQQPAVAVGSSAMASVKSQMLNEFRKRREGQGGPISPVSVAASSNGSDSKYDFVRQSAAEPSYSKQAKEAVQKRTNFDYKTFVQRDMIDGGVMKDAILADALGDYDASN